MKAVKCDSSHMNGKRKNEFMCKNLPCTEMLVLRGICQRIEGYGPPADCLKVRYKSK
jgi:hypothetical protein